MNDKPIIIFTDGSARGNPGPGGYGAVIIDDKEVSEIGGREAHTTNNRMELRAAIEALILIREKRNSVVKIFSDSSYLVKGVSSWIFGWQKNGWKTKARKDVENKDLWEKLLDASRGINIQWNIIAGHSGCVGNERCDEIATAFADDNQPILYSGPFHKYPVKNII